MTSKNPSDRVVYPQTAVEWRIWLKISLDVDDSQGRKMVEDNSFPLGLLVDIWNEIFNSKNGYSPSFVPALTRNKQGFIEWVYLGHLEPNWSQSD